MKVSDQAEEILEALWIATEEEARDGVSLEELKVARCDDWLRELEDRGYVEIGNGKIRLREEGRPEALMTVRRHRLAERLFMDVFDLKGQKGDATACEFEHLLHHGVDTKICTLLNHPATCPHGKPIPPGRCCDDARTGRFVGAVSLTDLKPGESGAIASLCATDPKKMHKLLSMGVIPGGRLVLKRRFPSFIFRVGDTEFAVDEVLAREILVRRE